MNSRLANFNDPKSEFRTCLDLPRTRSALGRIMDRKVIANGLCPNNGPCY